MNLTGLSDMDIENTLALNKCPDSGKARLSRSKALSSIAPSAKVAAFSLASRSAKTVDDSSPTKELDALVLGNTLVGYGDNISLENMMIIENLIKYSKLEADREARGSNSPAAWHQEFLSCMEDMGCSVPINSSVEYRKREFSGTMKNVVTTVVKAGLDAAKAAIPGATVLSAVADSTLAALEKEPDVINVFNYEVTKAKGVKLAILPCEQAKNGLIVISYSSVNYVGDKVVGGLLFLDVRVNSLDIYQGANFMVFNPLTYAEIKEDIETILAQHRKEVLAKRFPRRRQSS